MRFLARRICDEERKKPDVKGVLLFGSVAKGNVHAESDLDIVVIKEGQDEPIKRNKHERQGIRVDMWEHSLSCYKRLFQKDWSPSEMFMFSIFLNILQECAILYDPEGRFRGYKEKAFGWSWPRDCTDFIEKKWERGLNTVKKIDDPFKKLASIRRLLLVKACRHLLELGRPVSIRNKDYYLIFSELSPELSIKDFKRVFGRTPSQGELKKLVKRSLSLFDKEVPQRGPWTELLDAWKHLSRGDLFLAAISLQNGVYYLGRVGLENRGVRVEEKGYLWPESEVELIEKSRRNWPEFYEIYKRIHNVKSWRADEINECFERIFL
ncbi:MAG: nucleotidyltransferase domain-containing protein [Candidatus Bathyarchaeia archaeon]|nr:nucleotidyltransferase domain-containing protein [Candidatus Bathyarchaeia archaeon]